MQTESAISTLLTLQEVAKMLKVSPKTVRDWTDQGLLASYNIGPRHLRRFRPEEVQSFLADQRHQPRRLTDEIARDN
jgi:excisionase family DNA binding protein